VLVEIVLLVINNTVSLQMKKGGQEPEEGPQLMYNQLRKFISVVVSISLRDKFN
jgi:hypothetical protein